MKVGILFFAAFIVARPADGMVHVALPSAGIDQRLGETLPTDVVLNDETGIELHSGALFRGRPLALVFAYFSCVNLCSLVLKDLGHTLAASGLTPGKDLDVVVVSIDPHDGAAEASAKRRQVLKDFDGAQIDSGGLRFLTGKAGETRRLADAAGFHYAYDAESRQFRHAAAVIVVTPGARISQYLLGLDFASRDLRLATLEASALKIGNPIDRILLYCYHYDAKTGRYAPRIALLLKTFGMATLVTIGLVIARATRPQSISRKSPKVSA